MDFSKIKDFIKENYILIIILLFALVLRLFFISPIKIWDETIYSNLGYELSKNPFDYSFSNKYWSDFIPCGNDGIYCWPNAGFRAPLLPYTLSIFYFFKLSFLINYFLPLVGMLTVFFTYIFGKILFNKKVGLMSAFLLSITPLHVITSGKILTDTFSTFLVLISLICFYLGFQKENNKYKVLFGLFLGLSLLARYTVLWIIPIFLIYFLIRDKSLKILKDKYLWYSIIIFLIVLSPWFLYGYSEYNNVFGAFVHGAKAAKYWGGNQPWYFFLSQWIKIFSFIGIIFIISLIFVIYKKKFVKKEIYLLLIWIFIFIIMSLLVGHKEERFLLPIFPAISLFSGYFLFKCRNIKLLFLVFIIISIFSSAYLLYDSYKKTIGIYDNINTACFLETIGYLKKINSPFVMVNENPPVFYYYIKEESSYYPDLLNQENIDYISISKKKPVYFIYTRLNSGFPKEKQGILKEYLEENYDLVFNCSKDSEMNFIYTDKNHKIST